MNRLKELRRAKGLTQEEIARLLDRSPATVRSQLMRGRDRLGVLLEEG